MKDKIPKIESMLVIHQGALGDFILALPVLANLRNTFPRAKSVIMGYPRILQLVEGRFYAEEICSIDQKGMATFFVRQGSLDSTLVHFFSAFDLIVVFGKDGEGTLIGNLKKASQGEVLHINPFPKWDEGVHVTDHLLNQLIRYEIPISDTNPHLFLKEEDRTWGRDFWSKKGISAEERSKTIVLHPGSGSKKKVYPLAQFRSLFQYLQTHLRGTILVILGPAEGPEVQKVFEESGGPPPVFAKGLSLLQLASVIEGCRLFVGNDSGVSHMAAALHLPTIAIFGPTDHRAWSPRGKEVVVVRREVPCSPCAEERFFLCKDPECLKGIALGQIIEEMKRAGVEI